jgi:hypothetical protein
MFIPFTYHVTYVIQSNCMILKLGQAVIQKIVLKIRTYIRLYINVKIKQYLVYIIIIIIMIMIIINSLLKKVQYMNILQRKKRNCIKIIVKK